jgi:hypothetical protein
MPNTSEDQAHVCGAIAELTAALERIEARQEAARRSERRLWLGVLLTAMVVAGGAAHLTLAPFAGVLERLAPPRLAVVDPVAAEAQREALLASLTPAERAWLDDFEHRVSMIRHYAQVSPDFDAASTVALFLGQMSRSVEVMPDLYATVAEMRDELRAVNDQMRVMNARMDALPVLATEVQAMRGQVGIMAAGMDSTMGRAGRMMPWNW